MRGWIAETIVLNQKDNPLQDYLAYSIVEKESQAVVGSIGCSYFDDLDRVGLVYFIGAKYRKKGYATSASYDNWWASWKSEKYWIDCQWWGVCQEKYLFNAKAPFVKNFRENYEGGNLPIYALGEVFSFGTLSKFYKNMMNQDKKIVAKSFGIGYTYLESWLESISYIRNICAHYGRLYNAKMSKTPILYKEYTQAGIGNNRVFSVLLCLKHLLVNDKHWNLFVDKIEMLFDKYESVDIKTMGFLENWKELLEIKAKQNE